MDIEEQIEMNVMELVFFEEYKEVKKKKNLEE